MQETCVGLAAQSVPRSESSMPAGFWPLPEGVLEIGMMVCDYFPIGMGGQVSNRRPHVVE